MLTNRSIPRCTVIPELAYADFGKAVEWLCDVFGFTLRLRIADHRAQLSVGDGAVVITDRAVSAKLEIPDAVLVRVEDVDHHYEHARERGAKILQPPANHPFGERQYSTEDFAGRRWTFSQSIADVAPEEWGGMPGRL
jgi:uncharacterized glyoxalase superfamily protein PhnB